MASPSTAEKKPAGHALQSELAPADVQVIKVNTDATLMCAADVLAAKLGGTHPARRARWSRSRPGMRSRNVGLSKADRRHSR
jgi:hypothetical protein